MGKLKKIVGFDSGDVRLGDFNTVKVDNAVIIRDLTNALMTRRGERVMRPNFGSIIHDLLFDVDTGNTVDAIRNDVKSIIGNDPRVSYVNSDIQQTDDHSYELTVEVKSVITNEILSLTIDFRE